MVRTTAVAVALCGLAACGGSRVNPPELEPPAAVVPQAPADALAAAGDCVDGVWTHAESGRTRTLTFRPDHTGSDVRSPVIARGFLWHETRAGTVRLSYPEEDDELESELEFEVDCAARVLNASGARYTRRE